MRPAFRRLIALSILPLFSACGKAGGSGGFAENDPGSPQGGSANVGGSSSQLSSLGGQLSGGSGGAAVALPTNTGGSGVVSGAGGSGGSGGSAASSGPCGAPGLFLCDDFEVASLGGPPDAQKWTLDIINSEGVVVDAAFAHSGSQSVKISGNGYRAFLRPKSGLPVANNAFFLRVFLRSSSPMGSGHSTYIEAGKNVMDEHELRVGYHYKMLEVNLMPGDPEQLSNGRDYDDGTPGLTFAPDTWYCLEVHFDGLNHEARVWVDDQEVPSLHVTNWNPNAKDGFQNRTNWAPTFASAGVGYEKYSGDPATLWYDDVAFGTERIGCR